MKMEIMVSGPIDTNAYLLKDETTGEAVLIDAPHDVSPQLARSLKGGTRVAMLVNTHGHWDHIGDNEAVMKITHAPLAIHAADAPMLADGGSYGWETPSPARASKPGRMLADGDIVSLGSTRLLVMHTPGHTPGCICLYDEAGKTLISGDTLFEGSCGRVDLPNSSESDMIASLKKLSKLPADTRFYPGHGPGGTIGEHPMLAEIKRR